MLSSISRSAAIALLDPDRRAARDLLYRWEHPILFDGTRLRLDLGWAPEVGYPDGVRRTVRWLRATDYTTASA